MLQKNSKQYEVAEKIGYTKHGFNNLLNRDNYKLNDIIKIADALGYDVNIQFVDRATNRVINTNEE